MENNIALKASEKIAERVRDDDVGTVIYRRSIIVKKERAISMDITLSFFCGTSDEHEFSIMNSTHSEQPCLCLLSLLKTILPSIVS